VEFVSFRKDDVGPFKADITAKIDLVATTVLAHHNTLSNHESQLETQAAEEKVHREDCVLLWVPPGILAGGSGSWSSSSSS
jgi:hypothetical protein